MHARSKHTLCEKKKNKKKKTPKTKPVSYQKHRGDALAYRMRVWRSESAICRKMFHKLWAWIDRGWYRLTPAVQEDTEIT